MNRRTFGFALIAVAGFGLATIPVQAKEKNATVVLPITIAAGKTRNDHKEIMLALKTFSAEVSKHPGLIDQQIMSGKFERPNFVHVSTWKKQTDWENLFGDPEFLKTLEKLSDVISLQTANVFRPINFE